MNSGPRAPLVVEKMKNQTQCTEKREVTIPWVWFRLVTPIEKWTLLCRVWWAINYPDPHYVLLKDLQSLRMAQCVEGRTLSQSGNLS